MPRLVFKLPDLGEGTVTAEIVAWRVKPGDVVTEDQPFAEMSTEKAVVELPAPVAGRVVSLAGKAGDSIAVGAELAVFETDALASLEPAAASPATAAHGVTAGAVASPDSRHLSRDGNGNGTSAASGERPRASPATRRRAHEAGVDLTGVAGTGPGGRIQSGDLDAAMAARTAGTPVARVQPADGAGSQHAGVHEIEVFGVRRLIAQRMSEAKRTIPHFAYVEEVDITALEALRQQLNAQLAPGTPALTYLPLVVIALVRTLRHFPQCNAHYDAARNVLRRFDAVHAGIATQTADGLKVPVVRDAQALDLAGLAAEIRRVAAAARGNTARRDELTGSTITVTSLGKLGGIVSTPILNSPEVAIIGLNKAVERPVVYRGSVAVRLMMNLSSSFDHRFVDGFDAAAMIQDLKQRLEQPAALAVAAVSDTRIAAPLGIQS